MALSRNMHFDKRSTRARPGQAMPSKAKYSMHLDTHKHSLTYSLSRSPPPPCFDETNAQIMHKYAWMSGRNIRFYLELHRPDYLLLCHKQWASMKTDPHCPHAHAKMHLFGTTKLLKVCTPSPSPSPYIEISHSPRNFISVSLHCILLPMRMGKWMA